VALDDGDVDAVLDDVRTRWLPCPEGELVALLVHEAPEQARLIEAIDRLVRARARDPEPVGEAQRLALAAPTVVGRATSFLSEEATGLVHEHDGEELEVDGAQVVLLAERGPRVREQVASALVLRT